MKVSKGLLKKLEELYCQYEKEVLKTEEHQHLEAKVRKTYLLQCSNFMSWIKEKFEQEEKE